MDEKASFTVKMVLAAEKIYISDDYWTVNLIGVRKYWLVEREAVRAL